MNAKNITALVLLTFVLASVAFLVFKESGNEGNNNPAGEIAADNVPGDTERPGDEASSAEADHTVMVYYFYTTKRCPTCRKFEAYTTELVKADFAEQLKSGTLEFHLVKVDETPNGHFIDDYQLTTKSVVIADYRDGEQVRWKNLARIWSLVREKPSFMSYVRDEITDYLGESLYE